MENIVENKKVVDAREYYTNLVDLINCGKTVSVQITGNSMAPFLYHMRDTVFMRAFTQEPKEGDICLFQRDNGQYVIHRIYKIQKEGYAFLGDGQTEVEKGIRREQILAQVFQVKRKGKMQKEGTFWWFFFRHIWIHMIGLRRPLMEAYAKIHQS